MRALQAEEFNAILQYQHEYYFSMFLSIVLKRMNILTHVKLNLWRNIRPNLEI